MGRVYFTARDLNWKQICINFRRIPAYTIVFNNFLLFPELRFLRSFKDLHSHCFYLSLIINVLK